MQLVARFAKVGVVGMVGVLGCLTVACGGGGVSVAPPLESLYASFSVEEVSVSHGEVRLAGPLELDERATELDVVTGRCGMSVGGGMRTRQWMTWRLGPAELARALGCAPGLALRPSREGRLGRFTNAMSVRLDASVDAPSEGEGPAAVESVGVEFEGDEAVVTASGTSHGVSLGAGTFMTSPSESSEDGTNATFRLPTRLLVELAMRRAPARFVNGGARTPVRLALFVAEQEVAPPPPPPPEVIAVEESSEEERGS